MPLLPQAQPPPQYPLSIPPEYDIPKHICQWCYEYRGRYMIDCMCIVCSKCFQRKLNWANEPNVCVFCNKKTNKKYLDLSLPSSTPHVQSYFTPNPYANMVSGLKIFEFQAEMTKRYCYHLEQKLKRYTNGIAQFVQMAPQAKEFFDELLKDKGGYNGRNSIGSKSSHASLQSNLPGENGSVRSKSTMVSKQSQQRFMPNNKNPYYRRNNGQCVRVLQGSSSQGDLDQPHQKYMRRCQEMASNAATSRFGGAMKRENPERDINVQLKGFRGEHRQINKGHDSKAVDLARSQYQPSQYRTMKPQPNQNSEHQKPFQNLKPTAKGNLLYLNNIKGKNSNPEKQGVRLISNLNMQTAMRSIRSSDDNHSKNAPSRLQQSYREFNNQQQRPMREREKMDPSDSLPPGQRPEQNSRSYAYMQLNPTRPQRNFADRPTVAMSPPTKNQSRDIRQEQRNYGDGSYFQYKKR